MLDSLHVYKVLELSSTVVLHKNLHFSYISMTLFPLLLSRQNMFLL